MPNKHDDFTLKKVNFTELLKHPHLETETECATNLQTDVMQNAKLSQIIIQTINVNL